MRALRHLRTAFAVNRRHGPYARRYSMWAGRILLALLLAAQTVEWTTVLPGDRRRIAGRPLPPGMR